MRLWHEKLIPFLPRQQLLGLHREVCGMRGKGWGKKHATVDYVFTHPYGWLVAYHFKVITELRCRGYKTEPAWDNTVYRGKNTQPLSSREYHEQVAEMDDAYNRSPVYPEHDEAYLQECLDNLSRKGIVIERSAIDGTQL